MYKYIVLLFCVLFLTACDDYLDINDDPSKIGQEEVILEALLPPIQQNTSRAFYSASRFGSLYTQHLADAGGSAPNIDAYNPFGFDALWNDAYLLAMPNIREMETLAQEQDAAHYLGIARVMMALNLQLSTDIWGNIPFSEAFQGELNLNPRYDEQENIYNIYLKELLDGAVLALQQPASELASLRPGSNDLMYNGDIDNWLKAAYALRARYYLHLSEKDQSLKDMAIADVDRAFDDMTGGQDLQLVYTAENLNPWFNAIGRFNEPTARPGAFLVNHMNGSDQGLYENLLDPRLSFFFDNGDDGDVYIGRINGVPDGASTDTNVDLSDETWFANETSPVQLLTYSEAQFIKAEAALGSDEDMAYTAFLNGIRGSMMKVGVETADIDTYISDPRVSMGAGSLTLADIMIQKYIAMFLQLETWSDLRRYDYDPAVYVNLTQPVENNLGNLWVQRGNYPDNEPGRNSNLPPIGPQSDKIWLFE